MYTLEAPVLDYPKVVEPIISQDVQDFIDEVKRQPLNEWFPAPLSKKGVRLKGDTAAGQAVETFLKIAVNNSDGPDIPKGRIEVKATREDSDCPTTMITLAPCKPEGAPKRYSVNRQMIQQFGYQCSEDKDVARLMIRVSAASPFTTRDGHVFTLIPEDHRFVICANGDGVAEYNFDRFLGRAEKKLGGVLAYFEAESRPSDLYGEEFRVAKMKLFWGYDADKVRGSIVSGDMMVEPRLKWNRVTNRVRDRGTGFRLFNPKTIYRYSVDII